MTSLNHAQFFRFATFNHVHSSMKESSKLGLLRPANVTRRYNNRVINGLKESVGSFHLSPILNLKKKTHITTKKVLSPQLRRKSERLC